MVESLKNLGTPQETDGYAEFTAAADELATAEGEVKLAAEREDTAGLETAESNASAALASFQEAAGEYGFEDCSEGPSAPPLPARRVGGRSRNLGNRKPKRSKPEAANPKPNRRPNRSRPRNRRRRRRGRRRRHRRRPKAAAPRAAAPAASALAEQAA